MGIPAIAILYGDDPFSKPHVHVKAIGNQ